MFKSKEFVKWLQEAEYNTPHKSKFHTESYREHVISVAYNAMSIKPNDRRFIIAALLHDIGKPFTYVHRGDKGATFYDHESVGIGLIKKFLTEDDECYDMIWEFVKYHMLPYKLKGPEPWRSYAQKQLIEITKLHDPMFISDLFALHYCDQQGSYTDQHTLDADEFTAMERIVLDKLDGLN